MTGSPPTIDWARWAQLFGLQITTSKHLPEGVFLIMSDDFRFRPEFNEDEWRIPSEPDSLSYRLRRDLALRLYAMERRLFPQVFFQSRISILQEEQLSLLVRNPRGTAVISSVGPA